MPPRSRGWDRTILVTRYDEAFAATLKAAAENDHAAVKALLDEFGPQVRSYARRNQAVDHESVANTALADAIRNLPKFRGTDRRAFRAYLYQIVRRRIADEFRRQASQPTVVTSSDGELLSTIADEETSSFDDHLVETDATKQLLSHLTDDQREVVEMRVLTGLSIRETAAHTGRSVTAVKAMQRRALVSLRAIVTAAAIILIGLVGFRILNSLGEKPIVVVNDPAGQGVDDSGQDGGDEQGSSDERGQSITVDSTEGESNQTSEDAVTAGDPSGIDVGDRPTSIGAPSTGPLAFPDATGWAAETTTGGRNGRVVIVNSLENTVDPNDDLVTFREAMTEVNEPRIIVFSVAGVIDYRTSTSLPGSQLILDRLDSDVTVACQSAPEPGITFVGDGFRFGGQVSNVIMRHCRMRNSAPITQGTADNSSCLRVVGTQAANAPTDYIFDHISCMWATKGAISFSLPALGEPTGALIQDVSVSNTIAAEGAGFSSSSTVGSSPASKSSGISCSSAQAARPVERCSLVGNFMAHFDQQSSHVWGVGGGELINNIVYNFSAIGIQAKARPDRQNNLEGSIIGNLVQHGPDSKASTSQLFRPIDLGGNTETNSFMEIADNYVGEVVQQPRKVDNVLNDNANKPSSPTPTDASDILAMARPGSDHLRCIGASRPQRDSHDQRVLDEFQTGSGTTGVGSDQVRDFAEYPTTATRHGWADNDSDGMPDSWEQKLGLNDPTGNDLSATYTNVEVFLNGLAQCPNISIDLEDGATFQSADTAAIPFSANWLLWTDGQTIEVCVDGRCTDYTDPDNDQIFVASDLSAGEHTATLTLRSQTGAKVATAGPVNFTTTG